jgi:kynurenine formamidase
MDLTPDWYASTFEAVKNWGRWGTDDERGALNLLTDEVRLAAHREVRSGSAVSCAFDVEKNPGPDNPFPAQHHMLSAGDEGRHSVLPGFEQCTDYLGVACHGMNVTHLDALCHVFVDGVMYNGRRSTDVVSTGASCNSVMSAATGIVGRGVLLDVPRLRGTQWLAPDDAITPDELEAVEAHEGVTVRTGDILIVSTGRARRRHAQGGGFIAEGLAGLHPTCIPWLRERDVAALGGDGISDRLGAHAASPWPVPIHQCLIAAMGVHLVDNMDTVELADRCAATGRWTFLLSIAPLRIPGGTGCAVNPIAVF